MLNRRCYRLGLWIGGLVSGAARRPRLPAPISPPADPYPDLPLDTVADAVIICDASGTLTYANAAARSAFGPDCGDLARLCYPSGQPVPPGQWPLKRVLQTGQILEATGYLLPVHNENPRILDVTVQPWNGGAVAVFRDVTDTQRKQARAATAAGRAEILTSLGARLGAATEAGEIYQIVVEGGRALTDDLPDVRVRLYAYDAGSKRLTRLASSPEDHPKRPRSQRQSLPPTFVFDAGDLLLWQVYVGKQIYFGTGAVALGEEGDYAACALPLLAAGLAVGHLSLTCRDDDAFADPERTQALAGLASLAALALVGLREAAQAHALAAQGGALREVARAVAEGWNLWALADLVIGHVCRITGAEVCTLAVCGEGQWGLVGEAYRNSLLFPERHTPDDAALRDDCLAEALAERKTTQRLGRANPALEAGPWRAFAGQSGRHSALAVPLPGGLGGWTVYWAGDAPLPDDWVKFLETLALLTPTTPSTTRAGR